MESVNSLRISAPPWWPLREWRDGKCEWRNEKCEFLARESASSSPIVRIFGKGKCKFIANFSATMVTSLPSISLSLSVSLSLSHQTYLTHNIGSASALPIIPYYCSLMIAVQSMKLLVTAQSGLVLCVCLIIMQACIKNSLPLIEGTVEPKSMALLVFGVSFFSLQIKEVWSGLAKMAVLASIEKVSMLLARVSYCPEALLAVGKF